MLVLGGLWSAPPVIEKWSRYDYFLRRPEAGRLQPSSKSGPEPPLSRSGPAAPCGGVPKVVQEPSPYMVLRAVWLVALRLDGVVFQKVAPELLPCIGDAGRLVFSVLRRWVVFQKLGWCSKKLSQNPHSVYYLSYSFM